MRLVLCALVGCLVGAGCREDSYRVDMRVDTSEVARHVDVRSDPQGPVAEDDNKRFQEEIAPLRRVYGKASVDEHGHAAFDGSFSIRTPEDVGGFGVVARLTTTLGEVVYYAERFRGDDDVVGSNRRRGEEVDRLVDEMVKWSRTEFAGRVGGDALAAMLDTTIRADAQNVSMRVWMTQGYAAGQYVVRAAGGAAHDETGPTDPLVSVALYLVEHGYVDAQDYLNGWRSGEARFPEEVGEEWQGLIRMVARKMKETGHADSALLLSDTMGSARSLSTFVHKNLPRPEAGKDRVRDAAGQSEDVLVAFTPTTLGLMLSNYDELTVSLDTGGSLLHHSGEEKSPGKVQWSLSMPPNMASQTCFSPVVEAVSARAHDAAQRRALGGVVLTGEKLAEYCGILYSLSEEQRGRWEDALSVSGGRAERSRLKSAAKKAGIDDEATQRLLELLWMP